MRIALLITIYPVLLLVTLLFYADCCIENRNHK